LRENNDSGVGILGRSQPIRMGAVSPSLLTRLFHRGWVETEAEVCQCRPLRRSYDVSRFASPRLGGYSVTFTYKVNGKSYDGILLSPVEVQEHDKFAIRYNPRQPEINNTFESEAGWVPYLNYVANGALLLIMLALLIVHFFFHA